MRNSMKIEKRRILYMYIINGMSDKLAAGKGTLKKARQKKHVVTWARKARGHVGT